MINESKPTTSLSNSNKVVQYETFGTLTTTFGTETRTFGEMATTWSNTPKPQDGYLWDTTSFPWFELTPWDDVYGGITNLAKPI
jgi:hypothetical protein